MSVPGDSSGGGRGRRPSACRSTGQRFALDIVREGGDWTGFSPIEPAIEAAAEALAALPAIAPVVGEATIVLASDAHVRGLNAAWRSQDKPTNILSFPAAPHPAGIAGQGLPFLGDIVLAAETLAREAAADGTPLHHHLQHLSGFRHPHLDFFVDHGISL